MYIYLIRTPRKFELLFFEILAFRNKFRLQWIQRWTIYKNTFDLYALKKRLSETFLRTQNIWLVIIIPGVYYSSVYFPVIRTFDTSK